MKRNILIKAITAVVFAAGLILLPMKSDSQLRKSAGLEMEVRAEGYEDMVGQYVTDFSNLDFYNLTPPSYNTYYPWECVWYACGRAEEKAGKRIPEIRGLGNGAEWYENTSLETGRQIRSNSVLCYGKRAGNSYGHVIFIEQVVGDTVYYTEANTDGGISDSERSPSDGKLKVSTVDRLEAPARFQGYIYLDKYINGELLIGDDGEWHFYKDGKINTDYTGVAYNTNGCWYVVNGEVDWDANGMIYTDNHWIYCVNGYVLTDATGLAENEEGWWYFENGSINYHYTGLACNEYGWWRIKNGKVDFSYDGLCRNAYGNWAVFGGRVCFELNGLVYINKGWYKIDGGAVDSTFSGLACNEYGWWKVRKGKVDFNFSGLEENEYGVWKVLDGGVDFGFSGTTYYRGKKYTVENGRVIV